MNDHFHQVTEVVWCVVHNGVAQAPDTIAPNPTCDMFDGYVDDDCRLVPLFIRAGDQWWPHWPGATTDAPSASSPQQPQQSDPASSRSLAGNGPARPDSPATQPPAHPVQRSGCAPSPTGAQPDRPSLRGPRALRVALGLVVIVRPLVDAAVVRVLVGVAGSGGRKAAGCGVVRRGHVVSKHPTDRLVNRWVTT